MNKLKYYIKRYLKGKITPAFLSKILLSGFENDNTGFPKYGDFIYPPRKLKLILENKLISSNSLLFSFISEIITKQNIFYEEKKRLFLNIKLKDDLNDLISSGFNTVNYLLKNNDFSYDLFYIPKKSGGFRVISKPNKNLLEVQSRLNFLLNLFLIPNNTSHGFIWGKSILTNAASHTNMNYVFNVDIKDFFPSISNDRVKHLFSSPPFNFSDNVCDLMATICCNNNQLPQGAPTSPVLTNFVCSALDDHLLGIADSFKMNYTRYADDITFSSNINIFNDNFIKDINNIFKLNGFAININKSRLRNKTQRQEVTGITVNKKTNVSRKYIRNIRAILHELKTDNSTNKDSFKRSYVLTYNKYRLKGIPDIIKSIKGRIEFIGFVRGKDDHIYLNFKNKLTELIKTND